MVAATFILLPREAADINKKVTAFYNHSFQNGAGAAKKLGYIPLPKATTDMITDYWKSHSVSPK
jgi:ABC-type phosphate transport system substrate-binding protein